MFIVNTYSVKVCVSMSKIFSHLSNISIYYTSPLLYLPMAGVLLYAVANFLVVHPYVEVKVYII